jgi:glutaredoxin 3
MKKSITIYTANGCAYCDMVKRFLASKGVDYKVVNLDEEAPSVRQRVIEMSGAMTVPVTVVETDGSDYTNITIGWNPSKLAAAVA